VHVLFFKQLQNGMGKQYKMTMGFFENVKACIGRQLHFRQARWLFTTGNALSGYNKSLSLSPNQKFGQVNMPLYEALIQKVKVPTGCWFSLAKKHYPYYGM
jgi:hypothetical protein